MNGLVSNFYRYYNYNFSFIKSFSICLIAFQLNCSLDIFLTIFVSPNSYF